MLLRLSLILLTLSFYHHSFAQSYEEKNFRHFNTKDGLTNNYITGIEQDRLGYIWIGTNHGLNRFDGVNFKQFLHDGSDGSIPDNTVFSIQMLAGNQLGIATDEGAQLIDVTTLVKRNLVLPSEESIRYWSSACRYICSDGTGNLALSTKTGFYIFSPDGRLKKRYDHYSPKDIGQTWMMFGSHLYELPDGKIMQQNSSGLLMYDPRRNVIENAASYYPALAHIAKQVIQREIFFFVSDYMLLVFNTANNSFDLTDIRSGDTKIFAAAINLTKEVGWQTRLSRINDRLWAFNSKSKGFYLIEIDASSQTLKLLPKKYFENYFCNILFNDKENKLWIGTDEGLFMEKPAFRLVDTFAIIGSKAKNNISFSALSVSNDYVFAGTDSNQIFIMDKGSHRVLHTVLPENKKMANVIVAFLRVNMDSVWVATTSGLYAVDVKNYGCKKMWPGIVNKPYKFFRSKDGTIWISSFGINTVYTYDPYRQQLDSLTKKMYPRLNVNFVNSFAQDADTNIWLGGDAIARWNYRSKNIDSLIERVPGQKNQKKGYVVMSDKANNIWTSLPDDGFLRITGSSIHILPENLIPDYKGLSMPKMMEDKIFTQTNDGVAFLNTKDLKSIVLHDNDGLPQAAITSFEFCEDSAERTAWFACKNAIYKVPLSIGGSYPAPHFIISELSVLNDTTINHPPKDIFLKHQQNDIRLNLSAINFSDPENMRFAYRFQNGKSESWIDMGSQRNILLTNISPGTYRLQVKVYAYDNKWPEQILEIRIHIQGPWWRNTWFIITVILLCSLGFYVLYRKRIKRIKQRANLDNLLAQTEMKALHSQMNPHFIFNCLNSIREMILDNENKQASHYLSKFAQLIRITLDNSTKPFISLKDSIDYLKRYLEMEQIRTDHFSYSFEIDESLDPEETFLPPMLIQPFIENAIWHGQQPGKSMNIFIRFERDKNELICIVEDDGIGIENSLRNKIEIGHHSVGIANIRQRIQLLNEKYKLTSSVHIEDKSVSGAHNQTGTKVTLRLPVKNTEP